jgi:proteasome lid subunit RPN8/RPN11
MFALRQEKHARLVLEKDGCPSEDSQLHPYLISAAAHAERECPRESCGLVVNGNYWPCVNIAKDPIVDFAIDPRAYLGAQMSGPIAAIVHSHPLDSPPSELDIGVCKRLGVPWYVYMVGKKEWLTIDPCSGDVGSME